MSSSIIDKIEFPDFDAVKQECMKKMIKMFPKYGNSWKYGLMDMDWWEKRLKKEVKEIFDAKSIKEFVDEIPDAINILAMMLSNAVKNCSKCNKRITEWDSLGGKILCRECYLQ